MKKIFFLLAMLAGVAANAQVTVVEPVGADYATKTVSFRVRWNAGTRDATHLSKVWVWVDCITVNSNNTTSGNSWTRAAVSAASPTASVSYDGSSRQGFWLQGNAGSYSATVTVKLNITAGKFNWCAYASDYPPNAKITTGTYKAGTYTLKGTKPFTVNGTVSVNANTYSGGSITSVTDATRCPGYRCGLRDEAPGTMGCCAGLTAIGGGTYGISGYTYTAPAVCRDLSADAAQNTQCGIEMETTIHGPGYWSDANTYCATLGWRLPTENEMRCLYELADWPCLTYSDRDCNRYLKVVDTRSGCNVYRDCNLNGYVLTPGYTRGYWRCVR
jgi:hypothetical protein